MNSKEFYETLARLGGLEVINESTSTNQLRFTGRVPKDSITKWLAVVDALIALSDLTDTFSLDLSRQYFRKDGKLRFAWRLILQSPDISSTLSSVSSSLLSKVQPAVPRELESISLHASPNRHEGRAGAIGTIPLGRAAIKA